ncbi:MAG: hypothetical protein WDN26_09980 [Chitinophagaceae bacterium]
MLNREQEDEECDATGDAMCTAAGDKNYSWLNKNAALYKKRHSKKENIN